MMAKVLDDRMVDKKRVTWQVPLSAHDPRRIRKTIAEVAPEESKDIHKKKVSRFENQWNVHCHGTTHNFS